MAQEVVQTPWWQAENQLSPCSDLKGKFLTAWEWGAGGPGPLSRVAG